MELSSLIASLRKNYVTLILFNVGVPVLLVQIVVSDPVPHKQGGPKATHDHPSCISENKSKQRNSLRHTQN